MGGKDGCVSKGKYHLNEKKKKRVGGAERSGTGPNKEKGKMVTVRDKGRSPTEKKNRMKQGQLRRQGKKKQHH